jgi:hypothetical protein
MPKPSVFNLKDDYISTSAQLGSNAGGFFTRKNDGKEFYLKWLPASDTESIKRLQNEFLALKLYELYGIPVPKAELFTFERDGVSYIGIASEKQPNIKQISEAPGSGAISFDTVRKKAQEDFLIDAFMSNYDVVGLVMDNLHYNTKTGEPFRVDPGGALFYKAQGNPKGAQFNKSVGEFEDMESGKNTNTKFNAHVISTASQVFKGAHDPEKLKKGLAKLGSVSDEQIIACIQEHGFGDLPGGKKQNEDLIEILLGRKETITAKAQKIIGVEAVVGVDLDSVEQPEAPKAETWFNAALNELNRKIGKLGDMGEKYAEAHKAAVRMHTELTSLHKQCFEEHTMPFRTFAEQAHAIIDTEKPHLINIGTGWDKFVSSLKEAVNHIMKFVSIGQVERVFEQPEKESVQKVEEFKERLNKYK